MAVQIKMPDLSQTTGEVKLLGWLVKEGDHINRGDHLCEVETDKATMPVESFETGTVLKLLIEPGTVVEAGTVIALLGEKEVEKEKEQQPHKEEDVKVKSKIEIAGELGREKLIQMFRKMLLIRQFEERIRFLFLEGKMPGTVHQYIGMEACAVGVCSALKDNDIIASTHRPHGHAIARGIPVREIIAELFGKETGCCKGKGGSMHIGDLSKGMLPAIAIVGANIPIVMGMALAFKLKGESRVAVSFFGDGASNEGAFHEGLNMAAVYNVPAVFVCENNLYGASTRIDLVMKVKNIADRAGAYGLRGDIADGMDVLEVYTHAREAVRLARNGEGPTLLELKTFRLCGHSRRDPSNYIPDEEKKYWQKLDPVPNFEKFLLEQEMIVESEVNTLKKEVEADVEAALQEALKAKYPAPEHTLEGLYTDMEVPD